MERKLTAILCADVFGYSRLMGENEEATLRTLSSHRKLIDSLIEQHRGRFVNSAGDSGLELRRSGSGGGLWTAREEEVVWERRARWGKWEEEVASLRKGRHDWHLEERRIGVDNSIAV
jgi:class 3 adenylate cyclase